LRLEEDYNPAIHYVTNPAIDNPNIRESDPYKIGRSEIYIPGYALGPSNVAGSNMVWSPSTGSYVATRTTDPQGNVVSQHASYGVQTQAYGGLTYEDDGEVVTDDPSRQAIYNIYTGGYGQYGANQSQGNDMLSGFGNMMMMMMMMSMMKDMKPSDTDEEDD
jgi:hypothetical protein